MAQISKQKLNNKVWLKIWEIFNTSISKTKKSSNTNTILSGLLTKTEKIMLSKRMMAYLLLIMEKEVPQISKDLKLSTSTIYKLQEILENNPTYKKELQKIIPNINKYQESKNKQTSNISFIDKIFEGYRDRKKLYQ